MPDHDPLTCEACTLIPPRPLRVGPPPAIDVAKVGPCPNCGEPTRRMGSVPISGSGLDLHFADAAWCHNCLQAKTDAAVAALTRESP